MLFLTFNALQSMSIFGTYIMETIGLGVLICIRLNLYFRRMFLPKYNKRNCWLSWSMIPLHLAPETLSMILKWSSEWICDISPYSCYTNQ